MIAVADPESKPIDQRGSLQVLSPEEPRAALLQRIAMRIDAGAHNDELELWKTMLRTVTAHFKVVDTDEGRIFESMQLREHLVVDYQAMARTARQWCHLIHQIYVDKGSSMKDAELANFIRTHVALSDSTEAVTDNFIKSALMVYRSLLVNKAHVALLEASEDLYGMSSPYNSVAKLALLATKVRTPDLLTWVLGSINDSCRSGDYPPNSFTFRALKGEGSNKGFIDVLLLKHELLKFLLCNFLDDRKFSHTVKEKMRAVFTSHMTYRAHVGYPTDDTGKCDLSWQNSWPPTSMAAFKLIEDLVYSRDYDSVIRSAIRRGKAVHEILEMEKVCDMVAQLDEELTTERAAQAPEPECPKASVEDSDDERDLALFDGIVTGKDWNGKDETKAELLKFRDDAKRMSLTLRFVTEPNSSNQVTTEIRQSIPVPGDDTTSATGWTVVVYDTPVSGESITNPRTRKPPLRSHYSKMMRGAVDAFSSHQGQKIELNSNVVFIISNGGKDGDAGHQVSLETRRET